MQLQGISIVVKVDKLLVKEYVLAGACLRYLKNWRREGMRESVLSLTLKKAAQTQP